MADIVETLIGRAESYRLGGPSSEHTAALLEEAAYLIESLRSRAEKAEAERDELQKLYEAQGLSAFKVAKEWRAKAEKAEATCEKLAAALEAFANSDMRFAYETGHCESTDSCVKGVCDFTVGDLLNAESALAAYRKEASDAG